MILSGFQNKNNILMKTLIQIFLNNHFNCSYREKRSQNRPEWIEKKTCVTRVEGKKFRYNIKYVYHLVVIRAKRSLLLGVINNHRIDVLKAGLFWCSVVHSIVYVYDWHPPLLTAYLSLFMWNMFSVFMSFCNVQF